jgi:hypothetical protein
VKLKIDIDCTPQEARAFFGLPDVAPMQEEVLRAMQQQMLDNVRKMDPEVFLRTWFPMTASGMEELRNLFTGAAGRRKKSSAKD